MRINLQKKERLNLIILEVSNVEGIPLVLQNFVKLKIVGMEKVNSLKYTY